MNTKLTSSVILRLYILVVFLWCYTSSKVLASSWAGDDWPNSQTPYFAKWRFGEISLRSVWHDAMYWNHEWMNGQGRFYPLQWIESRFAFSYLRELWQYKLLEMIVLFLAGLLLAYLIYLISESHEITLILLLVLSVTVQFRRDFDPHLSYAFLVPSLLVKVLLAAILLIFSVKSESIKLKLILSFISGALFFAGMSTYEYAFLLFPVLGIVLVSSIKKKLTDCGKITEFKRNKIVFLRESWVFLPVLFAWIAYAILVFGVLRKNATAISGNYVLGISWQSVPVFLKQIFIPLPLNNFNARLDLQYFDNTTSIILLFIITLFGFVAFFKLFARHFFLTPHLKKNDKNIRGPITPQYGYLLGIFMLLSPGFMLSLQPAWWNVADSRHGYLGVLIQEFGMTIIMSYAISNYLNGIKAHGRYSKKRTKK